MRSSLALIGIDLSAQNNKKRYKSFRIEVVSVHSLHLPTSTSRFLTTIHTSSVHMTPPLQESTGALSPVLVQTIMSVGPTLRTPPHALNIPRNHHNVPHHAPRNHAQVLVDPFLQPVVPSLHVRVHCSSQLVARARDVVLHLLL